MGQEVITLTNLIGFAMKGGIILILRALYPAYYATKDYLQKEDPKP